MAEFKVTRAEIDAAVEGAIAGASHQIAKAIRALPRVTEWDGSRWVSSDLLDEMATKLESL